MKLFLRKVTFPWVALAAEPAPEGRPPGNKGRKLSAEHRAKISKAVRAAMTPEVRAKISEAHRKRNKIIASHRLAEPALREEAAEAVH